MKLQKIVIALLVVLGAIAFFALNLGQYLQLDFIKSSQSRIEALYAANPAGVMLGFGAVYVAATALSFPGAAVLTLAAGAVFGLWWGTLVVSIASTLGATLAMLAARYVLRDSLEARFSQRLAEVNKGIEREGAFYLFSLRLLPVIPFFVLNMLMGLTRMRPLTFFWVSQLGMLAGTLVFVNAGTQLARIDSLSGILSPALLGSFALLAVLPWIMKLAVARWRRSKVLAAWAADRPRRFDRNLIVIGAGAGGLVTAYIAATVKAKVTLVEAHKMGGDCLNYGCVPSKALIKSAKVAHQMRHGDRYGLEAAVPAVSFKRVMQRIQDVIRAIEPHDSVERYTALGVDVKQGYAKLITPWTVEITAPDGSTERLTARSIVIAAGASPIVPPLPGIEESGYVTSDTLWDRFAQYDTPPRRIVVLGGGPIGCELAQALARLGSEVTVVESGPRVLPREDADVSEVVAHAMTADGVNLRTGHKALRCEQTPVAGSSTPQHSLVLQAPDGTEHTVEFDELVCAVGRKARLTGYGLETLGIPASRTVDTNEYLQTLIPHIYAVGDVAGPYQFTHVASHQAWYAAVNALFGHLRSFKVDYRVIPRTTFTDPEVARVGLDEAEALEQKVPVEVTRYDIDDLDRQICEEGGAPTSRGFVKVLTVPGKDRILGVTIVGPRAGELLAEYVLAMKHGLGLNKIMGTIHTYPTLSEANKYAAGEWKRAHAPEKLLQWVERFHTWRRG
jgi:pyruvate/2-oxoglutarate dehydrogenase complex dihydrolipoamide dehydrogenase (E3) component/uncharacterized membrane protein YdjX (TVP38/TMEM64 family)